MKFLLSQIEVSESNTEISKQINVLDALMWIKSALADVTPETVQNCFYKSGFSKKTTATVIIFKSKIILF